MEKRLEAWKIRFHVKDDHVAIGYFGIGPGKVCCEMIELVKVVDELAI